MFISSTTQLRELSGFRKLPRHERLSAYPVQGRLSSCHPPVCGSLRNALEEMSGGNLSFDLTPEGVKIADIPVRGIIAEVKGEINQLKVAKVSYRMSDTQFTSV